MRRSLLAANWKLHKTRAEASELARAIASAAASPGGDREVMLAPPFTALETVGHAIEGTDISLGAQNLYWEASGAFTGEVSAPLLTDAGCRYVIIGHSERRQMFGETDYTVAKKVAAAHSAGLRPIVCVGETLEQRDAGDTLDVVETQIRHGLLGLPASATSELVVAYEPVWAIGTGRTATPDQAQDVHAHIRATLGEVLEGSESDTVRILYGGSVKPGNVDELMACPDIDGALVGGASLVAEDFLRIIDYQEASS